jgi:zinc transport system substrate-binding protein
MRGIAVIAAAAALGCTGAHRPRPEASRVAVATIAPLADLTARVAGPGWRTGVVVPPGRSPHVFEPTPGDVLKVAPARLVVTVGAGYDVWASGLVRACASGALVFDAGRAAGIAAASHDEEGEGIAGRDPHWWLSPALARRVLAPLAESFARIDPAEAAGFRARAAALGSDLDVLDGTIAHRLSGVRGGAFLSAHRAWVYFADRYGLREVGSIEPVPGREPSPREVLALVRAAREARVKTLFTEPQFPKSAARVVANEAGVRVLELDPIGGVPGRERYEDLLLYDAGQFAKGLSS